MIDFVLPILIIALLFYAKYKKVNCYTTFVEGAKKSLPLIFDIFAYLVAIFIVIALFQVSGLSKICCDFLSPLFNFLGIPTEVLELVILKPFSGSGSLSSLSNIYETYGVDTYISRCASVIVGSSETVFYVSSVYFSKTKVKNLGYALPLAFLSTIISCVLACLFCKIF